MQPKSRRMFSFRFLEENKVGLEKISEQEDISVSKLLNMGAKIIIKKYEEDEGIKI